MNFDSFQEIPITSTEQYKTFSKEFDYCTDFLENLSELILYNGRIISFITDKNIHFLDTGLMENAVQTLRSIKCCCSIGSFADANTLLRKLRDDLLLYIYILNTINQRNPFVEEDLKNLKVEDAEQFASSFLNLRFNSLLTDDEQAVGAWFGNTVDQLPVRIKKKLSFENHMNCIRENEKINQILIDYQLQDYWKKLQTKLNNYVHNNGTSFTRQNFVRANDKNLEILLKNINIRTSYITSLFLILLLMVDSTLVSSTDLIDHLDGDMEPPENCQYLIAPFVQDFIDTKITRLHPQLKPYLKENNIFGMKIE